MISSYGQGELSVCAGSLRRRASRYAVELLIYTVVRDALQVVCEVSSPSIADG